MLNNFYHFLNNNFNVINFIHYGNIEKRLFKLLLKKINKDTKNFKVNWIDLYEILKKIKFSIKNCLNYKLKNITKELFNLKFINYSLHSECCNGFDSIFDTYIALKNNDMDKLNDILEYNKFDVCVLEEMFNFLSKLKIIQTYILHVN